MATLEVNQEERAHQRMSCLLRPPPHLLAAATLLLAAACSHAGARLPVTGPSAPARPQPGNSSSRLEVDPALRSFVDRAVADLARRGEVDPAEIAVLEARAVVWPDGSLGCPKPGMDYTQALQEGLVIRLQLGGRTYAYHGGGSRMPELCENPGPVATGTMGSERVRVGLHAV